MSADRYEEIIEQVNTCHKNRIILRDKWKSKLTPFNYPQYSFLMKIHKNIYINIQNKYYNWLIFNENIEYNDQKFYNIYDFFINNKILENNMDKFINVNDIHKLYNTAKYSNGPRGSHPIDRKNRKYVKSKEII